MAHEFAHVFAARLFGIGSRQVIFIPPGAAAVLDTPLRPPFELWVALAGPVASLMMASIFRECLEALSYLHVPWRLFWFRELKNILQIGIKLNWLLAFFNLLPCFPMDGGRMLRSLMAAIINRWFPRYAVQTYLLATKITVRCVAWPVGLGMIAYTILQSHEWIYLLMFPALLFCAEIEYLILRDGEPIEEEEENQQMM